MGVVGEGAIAERQSYVARGKEFFPRRGKAHRSARVDKNVREEVDLLAKQAHIQAIAASEDAPVDVARVVARRILAVIGEFEAHAPPRRGVGAGTIAQDLFTRAQP